MSIRSDVFVYEKKDLILGIINVLMKMKTSIKRTLFFTYDAATNYIITVIKDN